MNARENWLGSLPNSLTPSWKKKKKSQRKGPRKNQKMSANKPFPDEEYPPPPGLKEQIPDDLPCAEDQEPPPEDQGYCPHCRNSPCLFLQ
jgi:hypothetical protein